MVEGVAKRARTEHGQIEFHRHANLDFIENKYSFEIKYTLKTYILKTIVYYHLLGNTKVTCFLDQVGYRKTSCVVNPNTHLPQN